MSTISLIAAPGLTTITYRVENPSGIFGTPHSDAVEVEPGLYQAPEPANYVGVYWSDGMGGMSYAPAAGLTHAASAPSRALAVAAINAGGVVTDANGIYYTVAQLPSYYV